mmetsp:Transcript_34811/g.44894  ORF Transcript_34811/g.44894 Transcript_34811/m.44894 type:complete len:290 (+) Transcript_34811:59-928(+)
MNAVNRDEVNKVINDMSKGSAFHAHATAMSAKSDERIDVLKRKLSALDDIHRRKNENRAKSLGLDIERIRYCSRPCVVIDMDCFYAAVEMRDFPELLNKPMAVGGMSMISTANYVARSFGVRSAMPGFIAKELCPQLILVPGRYEAYSQASKLVLEVIHHYDEHCRMMSLDEAKIDLTKYLTATFGAQDEGWPMDTVSAVVKEMRDRVYQATRLTCSAGIGPSFMIAKVASDLNKPNGQFEVGFSREEAINFVRQQPLRKVSGLCLQFVPSSRGALDRGNRQSDGAGVA